MEKLQQSHHVSVAWRSFELRPPELPPLPPEYRAQIEAKRPRLVAIAREHYGIEINSGPFGITSRPALIGAKYAEAQGVGEAYYAAVFRAYWQQARAIDDRQVLAEIASAVGLEANAFLAALGTPEYESAMRADVEQAHAYGLDAVPALVLAGKYLVVGAQPYTVLAQVVDRIAHDHVA